MKKTPQLKPCPFCGGKAKFENCGDPGKFADWDVVCTECGILALCPGEEPGMVTTKEEAAKAWNRRMDDADAPD